MEQKGALIEGLRPHRFAVHGLFERLVSHRLVGFVLDSSGDVGIELGDLVEYF